MEPTAHGESQDDTRSSLSLPILAEDVASIPVWTPPRHERRVRWALVGFLALLFLPNLGAFGLWDPWETHYGAVTTEMLETHEWVSTWWGHKEKIGTEKKQGAFFYSKPVFIFWSEAAMSSLIGRGEWSMRLPMALLAMLAALAVYLAMSRIWTRAIGVLGAVITATSPQYFMIARQAQTDMPFVATLIIGMCAFMVAVFGPRTALPEPGPARTKRVRGWLLWTLAFVALNTVPQYLIIATDLDDAIPKGVSGLAALGHQIRTTGWVHVLLYSLGLIGVLGWFAANLRSDVRREGLSDAVCDRWWRRCLLVVFYVFVAQSTYAKGLLGFALPGFIILTYLIWSRAWRLLLRVELLRGAAMFLVVALPWYMAMFARHGNAYYQRFIIHDHFKRLGSGVHQIDSGTFEHFIKWLGLGMFPWMAFVPLAIGAMVFFKARDQGGQRQARNFLMFWFVCSFALFTISSTKFHHYIFPALPALAMLLALFLDRLLDDRGWLPRLAAVVAIGLHLVAVSDLYADQQQLRKLMTYKYDRPTPEYFPTNPASPASDLDNARSWQDTEFWDESSPTLLHILTTDAFDYHVWIPLIGLLGLLALGLFIATKTRRVALVALGLVASMLTVWSLNYYMPSLSPHWSQKYLFDTYYDSCTRDVNPEEVDDAYTPLLARVGLEAVARSFGWEGKVVCKEDVLSWRITWRGETYYSYNELKPITKEANQFLPYLEEMNHGEAFYVLMERGKSKTDGFKNKLTTYSEKLRRKGVAGWEDIDNWQVDILDASSVYFQMVKATPIRST
jgi:4-amino-4-deoxy-L-arabinose transferase-like glycosyltransferase